MADESKPPESSPIRPQPRPRVIRLNRATLAGVAIVGILILWVALWALGRKPVGAAAAKPPGPTERAIDVDRLQRSRAQPPRRPAVPIGRTAALPPPPPPTPPRASAGNDLEALRAQRALDASPLVSAFERATFYGGAIEARAGVDRAATVSPFPPDFPGSPASTATPGAPPDPGYKERKEQFLEAGGGEGRERSVHAQVQAPLSPFTLTEGSYLPAILTAGVESDLPGQTTALVRENVYDSTTGRFLLIPSGSRLLGTYDSRIAYGQKRVLIAWERLVFPDGSSLDLGRMPGADLAGEAGLRDRVNNHFVRTFGQALILSVFSAGAQLSQPQESSFGGAPSARQIATAALGQEINRTASLILRRNLDIEPTLEIRPGKLFFVQLTADLVFPGPYS